MKKEIIYLSLPDHFNKYLLINYNQKYSLKDNLYLQFRLSNNNHLGSAIKAIYILELIFPKKVKAFKVIIKKKKQKGLLKTSNNFKLFDFNLNLSGYEFVDMMRYFINNPQQTNKIKNIETNLLVSKKLKLFEFNIKLKIVPKKLTNSFEFLVQNHLN